MGQNWVPQNFGPYFDPGYRFPWQPHVNSDVTIELAVADLPNSGPTLKTLRRRLVGVYRGDLHHYPYNFGENFPSPKTQDL